MNKTYNIVQIGTFDVENFGDLLFSDLLTKEFQKRVSIEKIFYLSPNKMAMPFYNIELYALDQLEDILTTEKIDLIVIGGGDLIRLDSNIASGYEESFKIAVNLWQAPILLAHQYDVPIVFNALGVPFSFTEEQSIVTRKLLNSVDYLSVRDDWSRSILENIGVMNCLTIPDTINIIKNTYPKEFLNTKLCTLIKSGKFPPIDKYMILQHNNSIDANNTEYFEKLREFIAQVSRDLNIILLPIGYVHNDIRFLEKIYDENNPNVYLLTEKYHPVDMLSIIANSSGYFGTSLHGAVTSNAYEIPIITINPCELVKVSGYMNIIKKDNFMVSKLDDLKAIYDTEFESQRFDVNKHLETVISKHFDEMTNIMIHHKTSVQKEPLLDSTFLCQFYTATQQNNMFKSELEDVKADNLNLSNELHRIQNLYNIEHAQFSDLTSRKFYKLYRTFEKAVHKLKGQK